MKSAMLLPNRFKKICWFILVPTIIIGLTLLFMGTDSFSLKVPVFAIYSDGGFLGQSKFLSIINTDIIFTLIGVLFIIGGLLVGFSQEKNEDEFIASLRLNSLLWSFIVSYLLLLFAYLFIYGLIFLNVVIYNMFVPLAIFILRFNYLLFKNKKSLSHAE